MIEQKLVSGRRLNWSVPLAKTYAGKDGDVVTQPPSMLAIEESTGAFTKKSNVMAMTVPHAKVHRNFQWLDYCPGKSVVTPLVGMDVLTGEMSGCYIIVIQDGTNRYVAHVGTDFGNDVRNAAVKKGWLDHIASPNVTVLGGFNPARYWRGPVPEGDADFAVGVMLAVVTTALDFYGVMVYKASPSNTRTQAKTGLLIGKSQKFNSCSLAELSQLPSQGEARQLGYLT